jgi:hypothetical protein
MFGQLRRIALKLIGSSRAIGEREVAIRPLKATLNLVLTGTSLLGSVWRILLGLEPSRRSQECYSEHHDLCHNEPPEVFRLFLDCPE